MSDEIRDLVFKYISDSLEIPMETLSDDFDIVKYIKERPDREYNEKYLFFWGEFLKNFDIYNEAYDFDVFSKGKNYSYITRKIVKFLFSLEIVGARSTIIEAKIRDLVDSAKQKRVSPGIKIIPDR